MNFEEHASAIEHAAKNLYQAIEKGKQNNIDFDVYISDNIRSLGSRKTYHCEQVDSPRLSSGTQGVDDKIVREIESDIRNYASELVSRLNEAMDDHYSFDVSCLYSHDEPCVFVNARGSYVRMP